MMLLGRRLTDPGEGWWVQGRKVLLYLLLLLLSFALLFPMLSMLTHSFMDRKEAAQAFSFLADGTGRQAGEGGGWVGFRLIPGQVSLMQYYHVLLREPKFLMMFWNSVILVVPIVLGQLVVSMFGAYAFGKLRFPFRDRIFFVYIIVMMMPFQVTLVPNYIVLKGMSLLDTYAAVILPGMFTTFGVFLLRQFIKSVPDQYCEAGKMDGAGYLRVFAEIILPQCKGALASLCILIFVDNWNMVEQPLIFLKDPSMHPLSILLSGINSEDIGIAFACGFLYMIPTLLVFLYGENFFIEGIQLSGIK